MSSKGRNSTASEGASHGEEPMIITQNLRKMLEEERQRNGISTRSPKKQSMGKKSSDVRPNFLLCYLCGNMFGTHSLSIHQEQCYVKKMIGWERADRTKRGPRPESPHTHERKLKERGISIGGASAESGSVGFSKEGSPASAFGGGSGASAKSMERFNAAQQEYYNENILRPCPNCGRTFRPEALEIHSRSCRPGSSAKPIVRRQGSASVGSQQSAAGRNSLSTGSLSPAARGGGSVGRNSASFGSGGLDEQPIRPAAGGYTLPEGNLEDAIPGAGNAKVKLPAKNAWEDGAAAGNGNHAAHPAGHEEDIEFHFEEVDEPHENLTSTLPPDEKRHFARAIEAARLVSDGDEELTSHSTILFDEPSMNADEIVIADPFKANPKAAFTSHEETEIAHASDAYKTDAHPRISNASSSSATNSAIRRGGVPVRPSPSPAQSKEASLSRPSPRKSGQTDYSVGDTEDLEHDEEVKRTIPLNNVSRFQHVQSRLKMDRKASAQKELPRCQFCNRTFVPNRLEKHESVCLERNVVKPLPPPKGNRRPASSGAKNSAAPKGAEKPGSGAAPQQNSSGRISRNLDDTDTTVNNKSCSNLDLTTNSELLGGSAARLRRTLGSPRRSSSGGRLTPRTRFCSFCGSKLKIEDQKFCVDCGVKLDPKV